MIKNINKNSDIPKKKYQFVKNVEILAKRLKVTLYYMDSNYVDLAN